MNKIYRIVFNTVTGRWVVASELATGRKKAASSAPATLAALTFVLGAVGASSAFAAPAPANSYTSGLVSNGGGTCFNSSDPGVIASSASECNSGGGYMQAAMISYDAAGNWGAYVTVNDPNSVRLGAGGVDKLTITNTGLSVLDTLSMSNHKITGLADGTVASDAATYGQLVSATKYFHVNSTLADSLATGPEAIAVGGGAVSSGTGSSIAIGQNTSSVGQATIAVGQSASSLGSASIAIGQRAANVAGANNSISIGGDSKSGDKSVAMGNGADASTASWATAIGTNSKVTGLSGLAVGETSQAGGTSAVALGSNANASAGNSVALGARSTTTADLTQAGYNPGSAALSGTASTANGEVSIGSAGKERRLTNLAAGSALTDAVNVSQLKAQDATVDKQGADTAAALGGGSTYNATTGAVSAPSYALSNANSIGGTSGAAADVGAGFVKVDGALGKLNTAVTQNTSDISALGGRVTTAEGNINTLNTNVAGNTSSINSLQTTVNNISNGTVGLVQQSVAGANLTVGKDTDGAAVDFTGTNGARKLLNVADGTVAANSKDAVNGGQLYTTNQAVTQNTTDIAGNTAAITVAKDSDGTSVNMAGTAGDRVVTGVAAAKADNDAVNLGQLKSAGVIGANGESKSVMTYDDAGKTSMTMGGEGATTAVTIHNVADGVADHDAVNVSQLNTRLQQNTTEVLVQANSYTDQKIDDVWNGMDKLATQVMKQDRSISQHGAMSMAQAQMASGAAAAAVGNPNGAWSVGLGMEQGYGAISAGYAKPVGKKSQVSFGAAFSGDERSVGVGFAHKL
ncbi:ESPR-type extended signal peptide-containing protein [Lysobacter sp. FW306-1B-D06B]|uniref:ESPR-type extended signal peptide-containing protein n=1 Tax=Lysobacter sp. FW306-1B-D06B TaxID=3140250 RepID=UPI003140B1E6